MAKNYMKQEVAGIAALLEETNRAKVHLTTENVTLVVQRREDKYLFDLPFLLEDTIPFGIDREDLKNLRKARIPYIDLDFAPALYDTLICWKSRGWLSLEGCGDKVRGVHAAGTMLAHYVAISMSEELFETMNEKELKDPD